MESIPAASSPLSHRSVLEQEDSKDHKPRNVAQDNLRTKNPGDGLAHPSYSGCDNVPSEVPEIKSTLTKAHKGFKTSTGTVKNTPGNNKGSSGTLTLLSNHLVPNQFGEHRMGDGENCIRNCTTGMVPAPSIKQPQVMTWVEVVRAHNRKV